LRVAEGGERPEEQPGDPAERRQQRRLGEEL
jgi:hypothetical protein